MAKLAQRVADRIATGLRKFQPILDSAKARDINESDTVVIVTDILQYVLGFDKYSEITSEFQIRSTYCDLAIKLDGRLALLIEVKAIGLTLKDNHVKQATDYAANQSCEWVLLTNGAHWQAYKINFAKPVTNELVLDIDLCQLNPKKGADLQQAWLLSKEGLQKSGLSEYQAMREALSRFSLAALLLSESVIDVLRRELRRITPDARIEEDAIRAVLTNEVLKREVLEGDRADAARRLVARAANRKLRKSAEQEEVDSTPESDTELSMGAVVTGGAVSS